MISIGTFINSVLKNIPGLVGDNVFPIIAPEKTSLPFIVYNRDSIDPQYSNDGLSGNEVTETIYILSDDYSQSVDLAEKVRFAFETKKASFNSIIVKNCILLDTDEAYNDYAFIQKLTFKFKTN